MGSVYNLDSGGTLYSSPARPSPLHRNAGEKPRVYNCALINQKTMAGAAKSG